jgi:hypothetical protein
MAVWSPVYSEEWSYYESEDGLVIFEYQGKEKNVTIPAFIGGKPVKGLEGLGEYLFYRWGIFYEKGVENVIISEGIITIHRHAFARSDLLSVRIPASVTRIESGAFSYNRLSSVAIPEQVTHIGKGAFGNNRLTGIVIPPGVYTIGDGAFANNCLTRAVISPGVCVIGEGAFDYNRLAEITIPDSVTIIKKSAFAHNLLTGIDIPESVTGIESRAFWKNHLTAAFIPKSLTAIGGGLFADNPALKAIVTDPENPSYASVDGVLFSKDKTTLVAYPAGKGKEYAIPEGVTTIVRFACAYNQMEQVLIPGSVTVIGNSAFSKNRLTSVTIPPGVKKIGFYAFAGNELTSVIIGMDVELGGGGSNGFGGGFDSVYKCGGKKAGKYTNTGGAWTYEPMDKEQAARYFDFKTVARVRKKKAAVIAKKAVDILVMTAILTPTVCFALAEVVITNLVSLILAIPYLFIRLIIALCRGDLKNMMKKRKKKRFPGT